MKTTACIKSRTLTAVSVFLVRNGYVFLSQRGLFDNTYPGRWQNVFGNVTGTESAFGAASRSVHTSTGIRLRRDRLKQQGKASLSSGPEQPRQLVIFCAILNPGEVPRRRRSKLPTWIPFPLEEVQGLHPMTPALRCSLKFLGPEGDIGT